MPGPSRLAAIAPRAASLVGLALTAAHFLLSAATLAPSGYAAAALVGLIALCSAAMAFSARGLRPGLFLLGFSLFLFGTQAYVYPAVVLSLAVDGAALALAWRNAGRDGPGTGCCGALLAALAALVLASTLLLPWGRFLVELRLFGPIEFFAAMAFSPADAPAYGLACAWRLAVFAVLARELARLDAPGAFQGLCRGLAGGLLTAIVFGLYEHFQGDHYLLHYRFTSLFANPGWFAEYAAIAAPYLLLPLSRRDLAGRALVAASLALCGAALVLTLARAGWIAGALTFAAAAWLYFRPGPLARFSRSYGHLPTLAAAGALLVGMSFWASGKELAAVSRPINALLAERVGNFTDSPRPGLFKAGLCIAAERPVFGMGFETYARHYPVLLATPGAWLHRHGDPGAEVFETSHNMYVQLVSGLGLAGLALWLAMAGRAGWLLWRRARDFASLPDAAMLLSLAAFHVYAFFQEMFYVPAVWFLLFVPLARAMALEGRSARPGRAARLLGLAAWALAGAGAVSYALDAGLAATAARLGLPDWRGPGQELVFEGFYPAEAGPDGRTFRWSAGAGTLLVAAGGDGVTLTLAAPVPGEAAVYSDAGLLGTVSLGAVPTTRRFALPAGEGGRAKPLYLLPGRTYLPQAVTGAADPRRLGLSVGVAP
ncbi:O-antigen ligase family protein [Solidesulfovibrio sp.]|uniref:O-antigen ligase family protein n=1 Tax=Solidesulfovibrio sp. TaxID=2910990 RepID=UPI00262C9B29|nr:O-antigen ligase family protein [Solidesulfovibrio sp.]